ncbi:MAG: type II toxin-antitoxin system VapC family toxin [Nitrospirae bacterium]|nr:MAG: type II toxin-antitoxin system VapC family toxin [Nitrospirota bacterium]
MSGSVLLDTNIVIGLFAKDQAVLARLSESARVFIPSIVVGELYFGAYKSTQPKGNVHRIEELVAASAVLVCDATTAEYYGRIKKALRDKGRPLPENDIWIAALAQQHGLIVVSRDQHFKEIEGLPVEAW